MAIAFYVQFSHEIDMNFYISIQPTAVANAFLIGFKHKKNVAKVQRLARNWCKQ